MINGLPGPMALATAVSCLDRGYNVIPIGFTGPDTKVVTCDVTGEEARSTVLLVKGPGINDKADDILKKIKSEYPDIIVIDYTHPSAVLNNIKCYVSNECDFVMGTTGGDPNEIAKVISEGPLVTAVIAPNMGKQIVAMQAALLEMSKRFPGSFDGYELSVVESHQAKKADLSGTAKAVISSLSTLQGKSYDLSNVKQIRDKHEQLKFGVPEDSINGHAFHTYRFTSPDKSVVFELQHNVCGRKIYAEGTADAVDFISRVRKSSNTKKVYNMIDVLENKIP
eukprot:gene17834-23446_t